jgi:hypothetical protein
MKHPIPPEDEVREGTACVDAEECHAEMPPLSRCPSRVHRRPDIPNARQRRLGQLAAVGTRAIVAAMNELLAAQVLKQHFGALARLGVTERCPCPDAACRAAQPMSAPQTTAAVPALAA